LWDALAVLKKEGKRSGSAIMGKVDESRMGTIGWSMGGGGTLLVAQQHPEIKATVSLCGWNPLASYSRLKVPALMFAGTVDVLAGGQSQGFYTSIPAGTPKMLYEVTAGHTFANDPSGESGAVGRYGLSWMKVFLEGDERYKQFLTVKGPGTTDWRSTVK
jgi:dienelactone hydrolase